MTSRSIDLISLAGELPGLDPAWSRRVDVVDADGIPRTWHYLERPAPTADSASEGPAESAFSDPGREAPGAEPTGSAFSDHGR